MESAQRAVPELLQMDKGDLWGEKLIRYALKHPRRRNGQLRPIIAAIRLANGAKIYHYRYSIATLQVDPSTWELVKRTHALPEAILPVTEDA